MSIKDINTSSIERYDSADQVVGKPINSVTSSFAETGTSGLHRYSNFVYEEFIPDLKWPKAAKVYYEMANNDPTIGAVLYLTEQLVRKAKWKVKPASDDAKDVEVAEFVESCMNDMSMTWNDFICEALSMLTYGWSFHEVVYKLRKGPKQKNPKFRSKYDDGKIGWRNIPGRSQHTLYGWEFAKDGGAVAMIQWAPPHFEMVSIPFSKGLLFRTKISRNNPEGKSLLRNAYRPWYYKKRIEEIEGIGIERDLAGLPVLQPPEGVNIWDPQNPQAVKLRTEAEAIVRNIRRDQSEGVVIPFGWELSLLSTGGSRQFDTNAIVNRYDFRIATTLLSDIILLGAESAGSFAMADIKKSLLANAVEAQVMTIADVINRYAVPPLMELNAFECPNGYPEIYAEEVETPSLEDIAKVLKASGLDIMDDAELYNYIRTLINAKEITQENFDKLKQEIKDAEERANAPKGPEANPDKSKNPDGTGKKNKVNRTTKDSTDGSLDI